MHIHILGICGTFMGGVAALAKAAGHRVTGSDAQVYPPMSTQLARLGIEVGEGFDPAALDPAPDAVVVGNVMTRGNPAVEYVLNHRLPYVSGPEWLARHVLADQWVLAVAGTHGKTTTASMLAWILDQAGLEPGFLIGGVPANFGLSARAGAGRYFVVEADEYDTAFFDKRSKFVHYRPRTLVLNNLEFDHADIFPDLAAIQRQFHHLVRTVPGEGRIVSNRSSETLNEVLGLGCWTPVEAFAADDADTGWSAAPTGDGGFELRLDGATVGTSRLTLPGRHNVENAVAAVAAARHAGVSPSVALDALARFQGVARRMQVRGQPRGITVYDDFAHHPTALAASIGALRDAMTGGRLLAVVEPRSNTMRMGVHRDTLAASLAGADEVFLFEPDGLSFDLASVAADVTAPTCVTADIDELVDAVRLRVRPGDHVLVMSNGGFGGFIDRLLDTLGPDQPTGERHVG